MRKVEVLKIPKGAAGEYAQRSFSAYKHCSNRCLYCYLDHGILKKGLGAGTPTLRTCFKDDDDVVEHFKEEIKKERDTLIEKGGIFFSFIIDPCLPETLGLTKRCALLAIEKDISVTILTKMGEWVDDEENLDFLLKGASSQKLCIGFSLTGRDDQEPFADSNMKRILAMHTLHNMFIKTFASIEPIIQFNKSMGVIRDTIGFCDIYKIGLMSGCGKDYYDDADLEKFMLNLSALHSAHGIKMYIKESIRKRYHNLRLIEKISVPSTYNIFKDE